MTPSPPPVTQEERDELLLILSLLARLRGVTDVEGERGAAERRPEAVESPVATGEDRK